MKKKLLLIILGGIVAGGCCVFHKQPVDLKPIPASPPMPPHPRHKLTLPTRMPLALAASGATVQAPPVFVFTPLSGNYRVQASSNLISWWTIAEVYDQAESTVVAEMVNKRQSLFFRVKPLD